MPSNEKPKAQFRPMTADEQALARALKRGAFMVSAFDREFAQRIHRQADARAPEISDKQAALLRKLIASYRTKVNPAVIPEAERHLLAERRGKTRKASTATSEIATSIDFAKMASDRDAWQERAEERLKETKDLAAERDAAVAELKKARHELDLAREENADLRRQQVRLGELRSSGLLWLINRVVFHPRGFALALHIESDGRVTGWSMMGTGKEPWRFSEADDEESFARAEETLKSAAAEAIAAGERAKDTKP
jgi:hypothetical protein